MKYTIIFNPIVAKESQGLTFLHTRRRVYEQFQTWNRVIIFTPYREGGQTFLHKGRGGLTLYVRVGGG